MSFNEATSEPLRLPCGQCIGCRIERSRQWALRCVHEAQLHKENCFLTLTYSDDQLPKYGSLDVRDWQLFAKRLRKRIGPFRYFMCGEYTENWRPHFHALLFGVDFHKERTYFRSERGNRLWLAPTVDKAWSKGFHTVGSLTYESAAYVARYVMKKRTGKEADEHYRRVDSVTGLVYEIRPEFVTMSRRPGLGSAWFKDNKGEVFPADEVVFDGRRFRTPRFYGEQLPEGELEEVKVKRREKVEKHREDLTPRRLAERELCEDQKVKLLKRSLT